MVTATSGAQRQLEPKLLVLLREGISARQLGQDALAGVIVGIVALPLAIAFAIASGVKPEQGLYTAIVAGFLISALGGSRVQIGGPTGAFVVIVSQIVQKYGYDGLAVATMMAGVILVAMGFARLGAAIKFVPYPVVVGFTTGIALIIARSQLRDFAGVTEAASWSPWALGLGVATVLVLIYWPRVTSRLPGPLVAIVGATLLVSLFQLPVETIGDRYGAVSSSLPHPRIPEVGVEQLRALVQPAIAIALLARGIARTWSWSRRASRTSYRRCSAEFPRRARSRARRRT